MAYNHMVPILRMRKLRLKGVEVEGHPFTKQQNWNLKPGYPILIFGLIFDIWDPQLCCAACITHGKSLLYQSSKERLPKGSNLMLVFS